MPMCQWIRKAGHQCKLTATKKQGLDTLFCTWHQAKSQYTPMQKQDKTPQETKILNWVSKTILEVVMTPGGGLSTIKFKSQKPSQQFNHYKDYEEWVINKIRAVTHKGLKTDANDEDKTDVYWELIDTIFPMLGSDKDDGGFLSEKADELRTLVEDLDSNL